MVQVVKFTPSVIEPSFGVGRILHALLEHSFSVRKEDAQRVVFQFAPVVAPIKCGVYNLQSGSKFPPIVTGRRLVDTSRHFHEGGHVRPDLSGGGTRALTSWACRLA